MVQTVKNLLKKSDAAGQDPYLALLSYRTTPIDSNLPLPAKVLNQRDYRHSYLAVDDYSALKPWNVTKSNYSIDKMSRNSSMMGSPLANSKS